MQRSPLYLYLEKVAHGDTASIEPLCRHLADRLIYVPTLVDKGSGVGGARKITVKVVRIDDGEKERVPAFTTEKLYKGWALTFPSPTKFISLLGGDLCGALGPNSSVVIDPGTDYCVTLTPEQVEQVSEIGLGEDLSPTVKGEETAPTAPALASPPVTDTPPSSAEGRSEIKIGAPLGRSEATSYMARPGHENVFEASDDFLGEPEEENKPGVLKGIKTFLVGETPAVPQAKVTLKSQAITLPQAESDPGVDKQKRISAAYNRPVIFSPDSDANRVVREKEDPQRKKRRSFLSFLKGN